jgi:hypothetical protein
MLSGVDAARWAPLYYKAGSEILPAKRPGDQAANIRNIFSLCWTA